MLLRHWPALCAWGAGLIHLAVAAGSTPPWAVVLGLLGVIEFVWGALALRAGGLTRAGAVLGGGLGAIALSIVAGIAGQMAWMPLGVAVVLLLIISASAAGRLRAAARHPESTRRATWEASRRPGRTLVGLLLGAALVAGLTTPALAMTDAGEQAVPHGEFPGHSGH